MIIQFNKDLALDEWAFRLSINSYWYRSGSNESTKLKIFVLLRSWPGDGLNYYADFHYDLYFLSDVFNSIYADKELSGDIDFAKKSVDDFLIRMSKLNAFT